VVGSGARESQGVQLLRILFKRGEDLASDRQRLSDLIVLLGSFPGEDRFEIRLEKAGAEGATLEFPNHRTGVCRELTTALTERFGPHGWSVAVQQTGALRG
jgi:hypothetical protein